MASRKLENFLYNGRKYIGVKLSSRLRLQFTHLNKHKFRHRFKGTVNPMFP